MVLLVHIGQEDFVAHVACCFSLLPFTLWDFEPYMHFFINFFQMGIRSLAGYLSVTIAFVCVCSLCMYMDVCYCRWNRSWFYLFQGIVIVWIIYWNLNIPFACCCEFFKYCLQSVRWNAFLGVLNVGNNVIYIYIYTHARAHTVMVGDLLFKFAFLFLLVG